MQNHELIKRLQEEDPKAEVKIELFTYGNTPLIVDNLGIDIDDENNIYLQTEDIDQNKIKSHLLD